MPTVFMNPERQSPKDLEIALRKLKKKVEACDVLRKLHEKEAYEKPTTKRKRKAGAAKARWRRDLAKQKLPPKLF